MTNASSHQTHHPNDYQLAPSLAKQLKEHVHTQARLQNSKKHYMTSAKSKSAINDSCGGLTYGDMKWSETRNCTCIFVLGSTCAVQNIVSICVVPSKAMRGSSYFSLTLWALSFFHCFSTLSNAIVMSIGTLVPVTSSKTTGFRYFWPLEFCQFTKVVLLCQCLE